MNLLLYEDARARTWDPFSLTRPIGEMLFGAMTLRERVERTTGLQVDGYLAAHLDGYDESDAPGSRVEIDNYGGPLAVLSSRFAPPLTGEAGHDRVAEALRAPTGTARLMVDGEPAGWLAESGRLLGSLSTAIREGHDEELLRVDRDITLPGRLLGTPWELVAGNADRLARDLGTKSRWEGSAPIESSDGVSIIGTGGVTVAGDVTVDPSSVLDTRDGPIHLCDGARLRPFTYLRGPAFVGAGTTLFGGTFEALSVGPRCKLRGEVSESIFLGYANKAHDGYIGHAVVGRWVNLGAFTTNSDLKNNYGPVRVGARDGTHETGMTKVGVFLGDHVKTGIGTRMNAGTVVGAGSNLYGASFPPRWVPPFHWGTGDDLVPHRLEAFLETAERAMARRDVALSPDQGAFLTRAWKRVHGGRS